MQSYQKILVISRIFSLVIVVSTKRFVILKPATNNVNEAYSN